MNNMIDNFPQKFIMTEEAHFHLIGFVNKKFLRNSKPSYSLGKDSYIFYESLCGTAQGVISLYFFEDDKGTAVTVNGERYKAVPENLGSP